MVCTTALSDCPSFLKGHCQAGSFSAYFLFQCSALPGFKDSLWSVTPTQELESESSLPQIGRLLHGKQSLFLFFFLFLLPFPSPFLLLRQCLKQSCLHWSKIHSWNLWKCSTMWVCEGGCQQASAGCLPHPGEHKTKVLWVPLKANFTTNRNIFFLAFYMIFIRCLSLIKKNACLVWFLTCSSWQCLFKLTKAPRPCSIHCARSLWSFSAVPLQPSKLLGESKVHIPAAGGSPLMRCLWLE